MQASQKQKKEESFRASTDSFLLKRLDKEDNGDSRGRLKKIKDNVMSVFDTIKMLVIHLALLRRSKRASPRPGVHLGLGSKGAVDKKDEEGSDGH